MFSSLHVGDIVASYTMRAGQVSLLIASWLSCTGDDAKHLDKINVSRDVASDRSRLSQTEIIDRMSHFRERPPIGVICMTLL